MSVPGKEAADSALAKRWAALRQRADTASGRSGRAAGSITVVAVSKGFPAEVVRKAYALGLSHIGENRVQEIVDKFGDGSIARDCPGLQLHLVGHLQSNKVRKAVQHVWSVDSVDSPSLAALIDREAGAAGRRVRVLFEVNTSGEPQKFGLQPDAVLSCIDAALGLEHLEIAGLMTIGPNVSDPEAIRRSFARLRELFETVRARLNPPLWSVLSMGMSGDFEIAIEEGATEIRVGTALFGERSLP